MTRTLTLALLSMCLHWGCSVAHSQELTRDALLSQRIIGSWSEGASPYAVATFLQGGGYKAVIYSTPEKREILLTAEGKWWIRDGTLYNKANAMHPHRLSLDKVYVDTVVDITDDTMILIDENGKQYMKKRLP